MYLIEIESGEDGAAILIVLHTDMGLTGYGILELEVQTYQRPYVPTDYNKVVFKLQAPVLVK